MLYLFVFRYYVTESGSRKGVPNLIFFFGLNVYTMLSVYNLHNCCLYKCKMLCDFVLTLQ